MHIGLIGGIGPAATIVYYQRLCAEMRARGKPLELTIVQADVDGLVRNTLADAHDAQTEVYLQLLDRLAAAGADCRISYDLGVGQLTELLLQRISNTVQSRVIIGVQHQRDRARPTS